MSTSSSSTEALQEELAQAQKALAAAKTELADIQILYDSVIEHGTAVEDQLAERNEDLEIIQARLAHELGEATNYVLSLIPAAIEEGPVTARWRSVPSTELGGDSLGFHWADENHFCFYVLDVCGHGVGAALHSVSAMNTLRTGGLVGVNMLSPAEVLTGMNTAYEMSERNDMYFTLWYGVFELSTRTLTYASGGHPPALLIGPSGVQRLSTPQLMIGGMPDIQFTEKSVVVEPNSHLFTYSDGIYELELQGDPPMYTFDEFAAVVQGLDHSDAGCLDALIGAMQSVQGQPDFDDDITLLQVSL